MNRTLGLESPVCVDEISCIYLFLKVLFLVQKFYLKCELCAKMKRSLFGSRVLPKWSFLAPGRILVNIWNLN